MRIYFAGPLFSAAERAWNADLAAALRAAGHEVFLPQDHERAKAAPAIFATEVAGIDAADALVAIMDGSDPDAGTAWECGYAYGRKPILLVRTDFRAQSGRGAPYNAMLTESASRRLDVPRASMVRSAQADVADTDAEAAMADVDEAAARSRYQQAVGRAARPEAAR